MSNEVSVVFNKVESCQNCPDRTTGCHSTCTFYIERTKRNNSRRAFINHKKHQREVIAGRSHTAKRPVKMTYNELSHLL